MHRFSAIHGIIIIRDTVQPYAADSFSCNHKENNIAIASYFSIQDHQLQQILLQGITKISCKVKVNLQLIMLIYIVGGN